MPVWPPMYDNVALISFQANMKQHKSQLASMKHDFQKQIQERDEDHSSMAASVR